MFNAQSDRGGWIVFCEKVGVSCWLLQTKRYLNLIGVYEFYKSKECFNLHEVIDKLVSNKKWIY